MRFGYLVHWQEIHPLTNDSEERNGSDGRILDFGSQRVGSWRLNRVTVCLILILYVPSTIFQLHREGSSWVEPVLS